ncbi:hypothetical protein [Catenuloplanes japonicus]|nr:hypothetical protein [Catenuloplanes japonicus]
MSHARRAAAFTGTGPPAAARLSPHGTGLRPPALSPPEATSP